MRQQLGVAPSGATDAATKAYVDNITGGDWSLPTGAIAQNMNRCGAAVLNSPTPGTGILNFTSMYLRAGMSLTSITFVSGATATVTPTNQWFCIYSVALAKLAVTADNLTTAWPASTARTLAITSGPYVVPATAMYYIGLMIKATTPPTLMGLAQSNSGNIYGLSPKLCATSSTGLTTAATAPTTAAALIAIDRLYYCYVS